MLQWIKSLFVEPKMTSEEIQAAILCQEALIGRVVFHLDNDAAVQLVREFGCPMREFYGTRHDN